MNVTAASRPARSVALDRDLIDRDERYVPFFDDFLPRFDGKGWAGIGLRTGPDFWSLTLHRSLCQGAFEEAERAVLQQFSVRLYEVGSLAHLTGRVTLSTVAKSFDQIGKSVVAIDQTGRFIHANATAQRLLDTSIHSPAGGWCFVTGMPQPNTEGWSTACRGFAKARPCARPRSSSGGRTLPRS